MANQKAKTVAVVTAVTNVEPTITAAKEFLSLEAVKSALEAVDGVTVGTPRSNGNICCKSRNRTFYIDQPMGKAATGVIGITLRFGFEPKGFDLRPYGERPLSGGKWPAAKGELACDTAQDLAKVIEVLTHG